MNDFVFFVLVATITAIYIVWKVDNLHWVDVIISPIIAIFVASIVTLVLRMIVG